MTPRQYLYWCVIRFMGPMTGPQLWDNIWGNHYGREWSKRILGFMPSGTSDTLKLMEGRGYLRSTNGPSRKGHVVKWEAI